MAEPRVVALERPDAALLDQVERLLPEMYAYMGEHGLMVPLVDGGERMWRASLEKTLGRFGVLALALDEGDAVVGFAHGSLRVLPDYLGGGRAGHVQHVFVVPRARRGGVGARLVGVLEEWFAARGVESLELQVLCGNEPAIVFWERVGFRRELLQMRRPARP